MAATYGNLFRVTIFGESHSESIGVVLDGVPDGIELDFDEIRLEMARRAPGKNAFSTPRSEADEPLIQCGVWKGKTTGTPICAIIRNTNTRSQDYTPDILRPSHADYSGMMRYNGHNDYRGGGHFSGRLTAPLVFAGAIAKQILKCKGVEIYSHIKNIGNVKDTTFSEYKFNTERIGDLKANTFPVLDRTKAELMQNEIMNAKADSDSVGGSVEAAIVGMKAGIGSPFFESVESRIAQMLFSVPAVKAVEFGIGTKFSEMRGSEANDAFCVENGEIRTKTNHNGGINGGITNGMPVIVTATIKPTPSIGKEQETVSVSQMKDVVAKTHGRHDPCIVQRAVPVIEASLAIVALDLLLEEKTYSGNN